MYRLVLLCSILALGTAAAEDVPYDVVTYDTVKKFCEDKNVEFKDWMRVYQDRVKAGTNIIYPKQGQIHNPNSPDQQLALMVAFYSKIRSETGYALIDVGEKFLVFQKGSSGGSGR